MLKLKMYNSNEKVEKRINQFKFKMNCIKDEEEKNIMTNNNGITVKYYYYYYVDYKGKYKELSIIILTNNKTYYMIYDYKGLNTIALIYDLYKIDYIKEFKFKKEFNSVKWRHKILNYKVLEIDHFLHSNSDFTTVFQALKNIKILKNMCLEEYKKLS